MAKKANKAPASSANASPVLQQQAPSNAKDSIPLAIYNHLPKLPFLDRQTSAIAYLSILLYLSFMAFVLFTSPPIETTSQTIESPLVKNSALMLLAGESYIYEFSVPGEQPQYVSYQTRSGSSCDGILLFESSPQSSSSSCISKSGNAIENGTLQSQNSSLGSNPAILFSPWMLAVSDNFRWQVESSLTTAGITMSFPYSFRSLGKKQTAGRESFEIEISTQLGTNTAQSLSYIDSEKRILLLSQAGNASLRLIRAPFALNWTDAQINQ